MTRPGRAADQLWWARRLVVAIHVLVIIAPVAYTLYYADNVVSLADEIFVIGLGLAVGVLQVRHSLAAIHDRVPAGWPLSFAALLVLAYLPISWYGILWGIAQTTVIASTLMLLRPRLGVPLATLGMLLVTAISIDAYHAAYAVTGNLTRWVYSVLSAVLFDLVVSLALYGAVRLVRVLDELATARADLADLAVGRERLRVSRDLHDLLGQSLSAVSLKGDLAIRLLDQDPGAARAEIQSLTAVAREALYGVRAITRDEHVAELRQEVDGAAALLRAAGIETTARLALPELAEPAETVLAWAVRECVTNVLRHSHAARCAIQAGTDSGGQLVWLEVGNDGAGRPGPAGSGLTGLSERATAVGGRLLITSGEPDQFRVRIEVPLGVRDEVAA